MNNLPTGFEPIFRSSPYLDLLGPIYNKKNDDGLIIGFQIAEKHCNARGLAHGGVFSGLADVALGYNAVVQSQQQLPMVTASLNVDYAGAAKIGDWVEIEVDVQKVGRSMAFANCYFVANSKRIARASAVFKVMDA